MQRIFIVCSLSPAIPQPRFQWIILTNFLQQNTPSAALCVSAGSALEYLNAEPAESQRAAESVWGKGDEGVGQLICASIF